MRGRKPKPPEQRALDGDTRRQGANIFALAQARAPKPTGKLKPPRTLTPEARKVWRQLTHELEGTGVLRSTDSIVFGQLCQVIVDIEEVQETIRRDGLMVEVTVVGKDGETYTNEKAHPLLGQRNQLRRQLASLAAEFGLTASSRSRVQGSKPEGAKSRAERLRERATQSKAGA